MGLLAVIGPSRNDQRCADRSLRRTYLVRMPCACHQARISRSMAGKSTLAVTGLNVGMTIALYSSFASIASQTSNAARAPKKQCPSSFGTGATTRGTTHLPDPATTVCIAACGARPERDVDVRFRAPGYGGDADRRAGIACPALWLAATGVLCPVIAGYEPNFSTRGKSASIWRKNRRRSETGNSLPPMHRMI